MTPAAAAFKFGAIAPMFGRCMSEGGDFKDFWSDDNKNRGGRKTWPRPAASLRPGRGVDAGDAAFLGARLRRHVIRRADRGHGHQPVEFLQSPPPTPARARAREGQVFLKRRGSGWTLTPLRGDGRGLKETTQKSREPA